MNALLNALDAAMGTQRWLIALDRDGTLVPYASRPERALMSPDLSALLQNLSLLPNTDVAIISARSVAQLRGDFVGGNLILAGNYGLEVLIPAASETHRNSAAPDAATYFVHNQASDAVSTLKQVRDAIAESVDLNSGVILEDHGYSLCLHFHDLPQPASRMLAVTMTSIANQFPRASFRRLPTSYEVLPPVNWDKGCALEFIDSIRAPGGFYLYAGDTESDTPAFNWVAGRRGLSIRVGGDATLGAHFHVPSPENLESILQHILVRRRLAGAA